MAGAAKAVAVRAGRAWLAGRGEEDQRGKELSELIQVSFADRFARRKLERQLADIADAVERRLAALIAAEYRGLADNDRAAVFAEVTTALERADLSDAALFEADADPVRLARRLRAAMPGAAGYLGEAGEHLYAVALDECCDCLVRIVRQLPQFTPRAAAEALSRLAGLGEQVGMVLERLPARSLDAPAGADYDAEFERRYLEHLGSTLDEIELFGVRVDNYRPRAALSIAYTSINVTAEEAVPQQARLGPLRYASLRQELGSEVRAATMRAETALARFPRTLLRGQAGSGKSTLLRWIAVNAARGGFAGALADWNGRVPFLVKLRSHADGRLPQPEDLVQGPLAGLMPAGWAHRILAGGRGLLLADGVDELPASRRPVVRQWLHALLAAYPSVRAVVSSRPAAAESRWLSAEGFLPIVLEPLGPAELRELVRQWHAAIRHAPCLPCRPADLPAYEGALLARLEGGPHLRSLAATPLLAAMMCALNLDRATHLPRDRMGLYAAALDLLVERRDAERGIPAYQQAGLGREQKVRILQDLAWQLTVFGRAEMAAATALSRIADKAASMPRVTAAPARILDQLVQRSGVIREPVPGRIDFVHRTVQEYLAAAQAADNADMEPLIARAHLDQWRETVIMAAGHANAPLRSQLLAGLLARAEAEPRYSRRLRLVIAACMETIPDLPAALRSHIDTSIACLIPPRNAGDARSLAGSGEDMLSRLPSSLDDLSAGEAAATVRTAWLINGQGALDRLARYSPDPRPRVQDELVAGWSYFDPREYAERVLADAPLRRGHLSIEDPGLLPAVRFLRNLRDLHVYLPEGTGLDRLERVPALARLEAASVSAGQLPALAEHRRLREVALYNVKGTVDDISPFLRLPELRFLGIYAGQLTADPEFITRLPQLAKLALPVLDDVEDFTFLSSQRGLRSLLLYGCKHLTTIDPLRPLDRLKRLTLGGASLPPDRWDQIPATWPHLDTLQLADAAYVDNIDCLASLPLEHLHLSGCPGLADITPVGSLSRLSYLSLDNVPFSDLSPVSGLSRLTILSLGGRHATPDLSPIASLPRIRRIYLKDVPEDTDLAPLARIRNLTIRMNEGQRVRNLHQLPRSTRFEWAE